MKSKKIIEGEILGESTLCNHNMVPVTAIVIQAPLQKKCPNCSLDACCWQSIHNS